MAYRWVATAVKLRAAPPLKNSARFWHRPGPQHSKNTHPAHIRGVAYLLALERAAKRTNNKGMNNAARPY